MGIKACLINAGAWLIASVSTIICFMLCKDKQQKQENKIEKLEKEKEAAEIKSEVIEAQVKAANEVKEHYEKPLQEATSGHKLNNYHTAMSILSDD